MPLPNETIEQVSNYCARYLPPDLVWYQSQFDFIENEPLRLSLAREFYAARYVYKLMEALSVTGDELHAHLKFQIIQYASIYEAVINYLLTSVFSEDPKVEELYKHKRYVPVAALAGPTEIRYEGEAVYPCLYRDTRTSPSSVKFEDKVDVAVDLGLVEEQYADDIKSFYKLRNSIHIETAVVRGVEFEIEQARLAYRRIQPFIRTLQEYFGEGLPTAA